ncbi:restriction endonuclease subunit S [Tolypothrix sp. FACHB-123]|uniref:restriction endonuclease subunit S n=1 Tax=Tolypothrix sp. FACHB-123 TaxID=2692868 RepID=UPI0016833917|nr:restriction endonuclease subunit S [Tolypothrix sp. FACHB-123]MBD2357021.1 restriction endonuclease subunit S [Tolypothrix sp. FACHB-123]
MSKMWIKKRLGEVCEISSSLVDPRKPDFINLLHIGAGNMISGTGELVDIKTAKEEELKSGKFLFDRTMVLYSKIRPYLMKVARPEFDGLCSADVYPLSPDTTQLDRDFLFYLLISREFTKYAIEGSSRAGMPKVNREHLFNFTTFIPPLSEQKRIVAILDEAFEGIERAIANAEKNLANSRELFESYRNSILTQENRQWQETKLGAEIDLMTGFPFKSNRYTDSDQSIRLLRGDNIVQGALRWDDVKKWPASEINEYLSYQLKEGDVVLAMDRPWVKAGLKHAMISCDDLPCLLVQRTACLRGNKNINNRFLMYLIGSHSFIQHILSNQTGIGVPHISGKQIQSFKFLKPSLSEQNFISDNLDELRSKSQRLETIYRQKIAALNELKQSILQKAFTGELTADTANQTTKAAKDGIAA